MTRENKLALVVGFGLILIVGILISDHLSAANRQEAARLGVVDPLAAAGSQAATRLVEYQPTRNNSNSLYTAEPVITAPPPPPTNRDADLKIVDHSRLTDHRYATADTAVRTDAGGRTVQLGNQPDRGAIIEPARPQPERELETVSLDGSDGPASITFHDVRDREALSTICTRFYGTASLTRELAKFNGIADPNLVRVGTRLKLPATLKGVARRSSGKPRRANATDMTTSAPKLQTYTIKRGDTLSELAERFLGSASRWVDLQKANPKQIPDPDHLIEGVTITIPAD